jgi:hypothetical protein
MKVPPVHTAERSTIFNLAGKPLIISCKEKALEPEKEQTTSHIYG